jgi:glucose/arabinose dehydrogenase
MSTQSSALVVALSLQALAQTPLTTVRVASGLSQPLFLTQDRNDHRRLFIVEQSGRVRVLRDGVLLAVPFLDLTSKVNTSGSERGLLGLALHPGYESNGFLYVSYTGANGATFVERYRVSGNPDVADPGSAFVIMGPIAQPFSNHNGGCVQFGPDGYLYISRGDGGSLGDPSCNAQNRLSLLGKILRIDVDGGSPYAIPPSNPFYGWPAARGEIWAFGLRNPWRFSFDRATGDLWIGDVGQSAREEIDFQRGASSGGENYGWKVMEGELCFSTLGCSNVEPCNSAKLMDPIHTYATGSSCSVIGGYVYRGCAIPDLRGTYFFGDHCSARIWSFRYNGSQVSDFRDRTIELRPAGSTIDSITSFGEDLDGELYVLDRGGEVFKIVANGPPVYRDLGFGKIGGNGLPPRLDVCGRLDGSNEAQFRLRDAPPSTSAAVLVSLQNNPTFLFGGTVVPVPPTESLPLTTNQEGGFNVTIDGSTRFGTLYFQCLLLDFGATHGIGISNAIRIDFP